jgi:hypothetical protein
MLYDATLRLPAEITTLSSLHLPFLPNVLPTLISLNLRKLTVSSQSRISSLVVFQQLTWLQ